MWLTPLFVIKRNILKSDENYYFLKSDKNVFPVVRAGLCTLKISRLVAPKYISHNFFRYEIRIGLELFHDSSPLPPRIM